MDEDRRSPVPLPGRTGPDEWRDDGRETVATAGIDLDDRT